MEKKIDYIVSAVRWFDKVNGNTYHTVKVVRVSDSAELKTDYLQYGYGDHYRQTALELMLKAGWIPKSYGERLQSGVTKLYAFERENNYPIYWDVKDGLKREALSLIK